MKNIVFIGTPSYASRILDEIYKEGFNILAIYTQPDKPVGRSGELTPPDVKKTAITFEYDVPSVEEFAGRIGKVLKRYPYLVAEVNGEPLGYAYAGPFKERAAYDWAVETTVYVRENMKKSGIGRALYTALE